MGVREGDRSGTGSRVVQVILALIAAFMTIFSVLSFVAGADYLSYFVLRAEAINGWALLSAAEVIFTAGGVVGSWLALRRRAHAWACLFLVNQPSMPFLIEANRCDVFPVCKFSDWARLPNSFFEWSVPIPGR